MEKGKLKTTKNEQNKTTKVKRMTDMTLDFRVVVMQGYNKTMQRYCRLLDININITGVICGEMTCLEFCALRGIFLN